MLWAVWHLSLGYCSSQLAKFDNLLKANCQPESYDKFKEKVDLGSLFNMIQMAQDASMETLDLKARQIANIKLARQQLWLAKTHWFEDVKDQIRQVALTTDSSLEGWGAHIGSHYHVQGVWTGPVLGLHINLQELETRESMYSFHKAAVGKKSLGSVRECHSGDLYNPPGWYKVQYSLYVSVVIMEVSQEISGIFQGSTLERGAT